MSTEINEENKFDKCVHKSIPVIALRGLVVMPDMLLHFDLNREKSILAAKVAMAVFYAEKSTAGRYSPGGLLYLTH